MYTRRVRKIASLAGALALALAIVGVTLYARTAAVHASEVTADDLQTLTQSTTGPGLLDEGYLGHGGWGRDGLKGIDYQRLLAEALGIEVDALQAAYEAARTAAIEQAVAEGLITRERADEMLVWGGRGLDVFHLGRRPKDVTSSTIDEEALLAEALGITVDALQEARQEANQAAIAQAIADGLITQEQADQMQSRRDLERYLDKNTLLAQALGMTVEELESAYDADKTLSDLLSETGLDAATVRDRLQEAYQSAIAQAVADGVITQAQADELLDRPFGAPALGGPMGDRMGGRGGHRGLPGGCPPDPDADDDAGVRYGRPNRTVEPGSAL
ncbi:MAG: hypothetical protein JXA09_12570 [Anaerolineae bacterium]|nr:hypothetical protein [Anaerolineae bacterium]